MPCPNPLKKFCLMNELAYHEEWFLLSLIPFLGGCHQFKSSPGMLEIGDSDL